VGIDVPNVIYRHLFQIRGPDGQPYRNSVGEKVGHLIGLCNEISIVVKSGLNPIFVFDGKTPELKMETARIRADAQRPGFKLDTEMNDDMKELLDLLGLPWIQAPEEAEAQTSYMTRDRCWASITNDYDALLFGSLRTIRSISKGVGEVVDLGDALAELSLDRKGLVEIGVLMGTDYNPGGIRGIGPKRALSLVRETGSLEGALTEAGVEESRWPNLMIIRDYYLDPPIDKSWKACAGTIDRDGAYRYLVGEKKLGEANTRRLIDLLEPGTNQREISDWT
jgi:flap endonuclease-1